MNCLKNKLSGLLLIIVLALFPISALSGGYPAVEDIQSPPATDPFFKLSTIAIITNNFMWRGVSLSNNNAAVQGIVTLDTQPGFYVNLFASNVRFVVRDEVTKVLFIPSIGFTKKVNDFGFNIGASEYTYPGTVGLNWFEYFTSLTYRVFAFNFYYANDHLQTNNKYLHFNFSVAYPIKADHGFLKGVILQALVGGNEFYHAGLREADYFNLRVGISKKFWKHYIASIEYTYSDAPRAVIPFSDAHVVVSLTALISS